MKTNTVEYVERIALKENIRINVLYYRKKHELTEEGLAEKANVSLMTVLHLEDPENESLPQLRTLLKISRALDLHVTALFRISVPPAFEKKVRKR